MGEKRSTNALEVSGFDPAQNKMVITVIAKLSKWEYLVCMIYERWIVGVISNDVSRF